MKSMKIMLSALLLSLSVGAYAQDEDELMDATAEEETAEVFVPTTPTERKFFHRVQVGFVGTNAKYTNNSSIPSPTVPRSEKYFLKGVSFGWMCDRLISKRFPIYLELGGMLTYHTGRSKNDSIYIYHSPNQGDGEETTRHYRIQALSLTIPVSINYQFRNAFMEGLTLAPFAGVYARFNLVANRWETAETTEFVKGNEGKGIAAGTTVSRVNKSLMKYEEDGGWMEGRNHVGKLLQCGAQVGVNAYYKHYSFGLAYMCDLMPFAKHDSPLGLTSKTTKEGGNLPSSGTGCDMKISTMHNFAVTVGYVF